MISLYTQDAGTFGPSTGANLSDVDAMLNILIELRVMNQILLGNAGSNSAESLRLDVLNETNNPVI